MPRHASVTSIVRELEDRYDNMRERWEETVRFLREIGPKDPRTGPFIAERVLTYMGEPTNQMLRELEEARRET